MDNNEQKLGFEQIVEQLLDLCPQHDERKVQEVVTMWISVMEGEELFQTCLSDLLEFEDPPLLQNTSSPIAEPEKPSTSVNDISAADQSINLAYSASVDSVVENSPSFDNMSPLLLKPDCLDSEELPDLSDAWYKHRKASGTSTCTSTSTPQSSTGNSSLNSLKPSPRSKTSGVKFLNSPKLFKKKFTSAMPGSLAITNKTSTAKSSSSASSTYTPTASAASYSPIHKPRHRIMQKATKSKASHSLQQKPQLVSYTDSESSEGNLDRDSSIGHRRHRMVLMDKDPFDSDSEDSHSSLPDIDTETAHGRASGELQRPSSDGNLERDNNVVHHRHRMVLLDDYSDDTDGRQPDMNTEATHCQASEQITKEKSASTASGSVKDSTSVKDIENIIGEAMDIYNMFSQSAPKPIPKPRNAAGAPVRPASSATTKRPAVDCVPARSVGKPRPVVHLPADKEPAAILPVRPADGIPSPADSADDTPIYFGPQQDNRPHRPDNLSDRPAAPAEEPPPRPIPLENDDLAAIMQGIIDLTDDIIPVDLTEQQRGAVQVDLTDPKPGPSRPHDIVFQLFPDADEVHVNELFERFQNQGNDEMVSNMVCNHLLENGYPKAKVVEPKEPAPAAPGISSEADQLSDDDDDSRDYYKEDAPLTLSREYHLQAQKLLQKDFSKLRIDTLNKFYKCNGSAYARARKAILQCLKDAGLSYEEYPKSQLYPPQSSYKLHYVALKIHWGKSSCLKVENSEAALKEVPLLKNERKTSFNYIPIHSYLKKEIKFVVNETVKETERGDRELALNLNNLDYEETGQSIECGCCYSDYPFEDMVQCFEGHLFCTECLRRYTQEAVYGQGKSTLQCMSEDCDAGYPRSMMERVLSEQIIQKFEERAQAEALNMAEIEGLIQCPHCDFAAIIDPQVRVFCCQNPSCKREVCRLCKEDWKDHFGKKCEEVEKKDETKLRLEFEEQMTQAKIRTCHKCKKALLKEEGCNKLTCTCGAKMCYICRKPNIDYNHFCPHVRDPGMPCTSCKACSLWSDPKEDDERAIKEIQEKAKEERQKLGFDTEKLIGAPEEPPSKKQKTKEQQQNRPHNQPQQHQRPAQDRREHHRHAQQIHRQGHRQRYRRHHRHHVDNYREEGPPPGQEPWQQGFPPGQEPWQQGPPPGQEPWQQGPPPGQEPWQRGPPPPPYLEPWQQGPPPPPPPYPYQGPPLYQMNVPPPLPPPPPHIPRPPIFDYPPHY